jgi:hypothetical protein
MMYKSGKPEVAVISDQQTGNEILLSFQQRGIYRRDTKTCKKEQYDRVHRTLRSDPGRCPPKIHNLVVLLEDFPDSPDILRAVGICKRPDPLEKHKNH